MENKLEVMEKSKLFTGISRQRCQMILQEIKPAWKEFPKGRIVVSEGEKLSQIGIIKRGALAGVKFYLEGDTHIIHMLGEREVFGLEAAASSFKTVPTAFTAAADTLLLMFPYEKLLWAACLGPEERFCFLNNVAMLLADENIKQLYKAEVLSKRSLRGKILTYFHVMETKTDSNTFRIRMNQEEFAGYLCVNRSALSTELNKMKKEGLIDFQKDRFTMLK